MEPYSFPWMIAALRASGMLCDEDDMGRSGLWLNMNDCFGYATADAEEIQAEDVPLVYALWRVFGWQGVTWWVWQRRGQEPIKEVQQEIIERFARGTEG